ncbi:hypothetical protein [Microtetraspora malaysiensis]|uniref:hypothetical protein n=1 Tax=Microtetraspora malaysiensis TaxID=161358 RepID=UPI0012F70DA6|nr:hypothetical protein [Microtetraspora malaysiensis]
MLVESLPGLMYLFARWAPAVQAAAVAGLVRDVTDPELGPVAVSMLAAQAPARL